MNTRQRMNNQRNDQKVPRWLTVGMMSGVLAIILIILYLQFVRYMLVGQSLQLGNNTGTALLLSPEISMGIAALL